jgi:hypothetical protein
VHGFLLLEPLDFLLSLLSLKLSLLPLLLSFSLFSIEGGLHSSLLLGSKSSGFVLFFLLFVVNNIFTIFGCIVQEIFICISIFANDFILEHLLESLNIGLEELGHLLDSESGHIGSISDSLDCELLELKHIVVLVLQLVEVDRVKLDTPSHLLLGLLNFALISLIEDLEEFWVNLEIIFRDMKVILCIVVLLHNLIESFSQVIDLDFHLLLLSVCKSHSVILLSSQLRLLNGILRWVSINSNWIFSLDGDG